MPEESRKQTIARPYIKLLLGKGEPQITQIFALDSGLYGKYFGVKIAGDATLANVEEATDFVDKLSPIGSKELSIFRPVLGNVYFPLFRLMKAYESKGAELGVIVAIPYKAGCLISIGLDLSQGTYSILQYLIECIIKFYEIEKKRALASKTK